MHDHEKKQAIAIINKLRQDLQDKADIFDDDQMDCKKIYLDSLARLDEIQNLVGLRPDAATVSTLREVANVSKAFNDALNTFKGKLQDLHEGMIPGWWRYNIEDNEINQFYKETLKTTRKEFNVFYKKYYNQLDVSEIVLEKFYKKISASFIVDDVVNNLTKDMENEDE